MCKIYYFKVNTYNFYIFFYNLQILQFLHTHFYILNDQENYSYFALKISFPCFIYVSKIHKM